MSKGTNAMQPTSGFAYDAEAYVASLEQFVNAIGISGPMCVVTHGFVLGQYGLLWALQRSSDVGKLVILDTPLGLNTKLRPELAAYKSPLPFLRPRPDGRFAADLYNASGLAYVINYDDAQARDSILCLQHCYHLWAASGMTSDMGPVND